MLYRIGVMTEGAKTNTESLALHDGRGDPSFHTCIENALRLKSALRLKNTLVTKVA